MGQHVHVKFVPERLWKDILKENLCFLVVQTRFDDTQPLTYPVNMRINWKDLSSQ